MSEQQNEIEVFQSNLFEKQMKKLSTNKLTIVEEDIDIIISSPEAGERKKSDLAYLWVHKFKMNNRPVFLSDSALIAKPQAERLGKSAFFGHNSKRSQVVEALITMQSEYSIHRRVIPAVTALAHALDVESGGKKLGGKITTEL